MEEGDVEQLCPNIGVKPEWRLRVKSKGAFGGSWGWSGMFLTSC